MSTEEETRAAVLAGKPFCLPGSIYDYTLRHNEMQVSNGRYIFRRIEVLQVFDKHILLDDSFRPVIYFRDCDLKQL